jgi:flavin-dependent thymidylate synthase
VSPTDAQYAKIEYQRAVERGIDQDGHLRLDQDQVWRRYFQRDMVYWDVPDEELHRMGMIDEATASTLGPDPITIEPGPEPGTDLTKWGDAAQFEAAPIERGGPKVSLLWATPDPLGAVAAFCRMYEGKPTYSLAEITDEEREHYWAESLKTHLRAPHETVEFHFFIENVDRAFTHQLVRQRTAVYAQESLRFAVKGNLADEVSLPPTIREDSDAADIWTGTVDAIEDGYNYLVNNGVPAEDARGLLPQATPTRLNYKTNLRNLVEHAGNRLCTQAQFIWRAVFIEIVQAIQYHTPPAYMKEDLTFEAPQAWQFERIAGSELFKPVCYKLGHCPFTADFDRGCTIRERVQRGAFEEIDTAEWLADPDAGRTRAEDRR